MSDRVSIEVQTQCLNAPGKWDVMISYTQRDGDSKVLAEALYNAFREQGLQVWLDIKMSKLNGAAMEEGVRNCDCVIAILSGTDASDPNAYFNRDFCVKELKWAQSAGVPIQPVCAVKDKTSIGSFIGQASSKGIPNLGDTDIIHLDRSRPTYWEAGVKDVTNAVQEQAKAAENIRAAARLAADKEADAAAAQEANNAGYGVGSPVRVLFNAVEYVGKVISAKRSGVSVRFVDGDEKIFSLRRWCQLVDEAEAVTRAEQSLEEQAAMTARKAAAIRRRKAEEARLLAQSQRSAGETKGMEADEYATTGAQEWLESNSDLKIKTDLSRVLSSLSIRTMYDLGNISNTGFGTLANAMKPIEKRRWMKVGKEKLATIREQEAKKKKQRANHKARRCQKRAAEQQLDSRNHQEEMNHIKRSASRAKFVTEWMESAGLPRSARVWLEEQGYSDADMNELREIGDDEVDNLLQHMRNRGEGSESERVRAAVCGVKHVHAGNFSWGKWSCCSHADYESMYCGMEEGVWLARRAGVEVANGCSGQVIHMPKGTRIVGIGFDEENGQCSMLLVSGLPPPHDILGEGYTRYSSNNSPRKLTPSELVAIVRCKKQHQEAKDSEQTRLVAQQIQEQTKRSHERKQYYDKCCDTCCKALAMLAYAFLYFWGELLVHVSLPITFFRQCQSFIFLQF